MKARANKSNAEKSPAITVNWDRDWETQTGRLKDYLVAIDAVLEKGWTDDNRDALEAIDTLCRLSLEIVRQQLDDHSRLCEEMNKRPQS